MVQVTDQNIETVLSNNHVVIDFWAAWCGPCRMLGPIVEQLSLENDDVTIGKLDVDANKDSAIKYNVTSIPTLIYFKDGKEVSRTRGVLPKNKIQQSIDELKN